MSALTEWLALSMGVTVRDVEGLLRVRDVLRDQEDDLFWLGLGVGGSQRRDRLRKESREAGDNRKSDALDGAAEEAACLPIILHELTTRLKSLEQQFEAEQQEATRPKPEW